MAWIEMTDGTMCLVDDDKEVELSKFRWHPMRRSLHSIYATTWKVGMMHRYLKNAPKGVWVDHINGNGLDNRLCNLRFATPSQNQANRRKAQNTSSQFKGVYWHSARGTWVATIQVAGKSHYLGSSRDEAKAAAMYEKAAQEFNGDFAWRGST